jgi:hypothetical protein
MLIFIVIWLKFQKYLFTEGLLLNIRVYKKKAMDYLKTHLKLLYVT